MKKLNRTHWELIGVLALMLSFSCNAQITIGSSNRKITSINYDFSSIPDTVKRIYVLYDSKEVGSFNVSDSTISINDSLLTIKGIFKVLQYSYHIQRKSDLEKYAAEKILMCIKQNGYISDKKKFSKAVKEYLKLTNP